MASTRRDQVAKWTALIGSVGAVLGVTLNWYQSIQESKTRTEQVAYQRAQLDQSWTALREAIEKLREDARGRDADLDKLRVEIAELRGAARAHRRRAGDRVPTAAGAAPPTLADEIDADGLEAVEVQVQRALPLDLPEPQPEAVKKAMDKINR